MGRNGMFGAAASSPLFSDLRFATQLKTWITHGGGRSAPPACPPCLRGHGHDETAIRITRLAHDRAPPSHMSVASNARSRCTVKQVQPTAATNGRFGRRYGLTLPGEVALRKRILSHRLQWTPPRSSNSRRFSRAPQTTYRSAHCLSRLHILFTTEELQSSNIRHRLARINSGHPSL